MTGDVVPIQTRYAGCHFRSRLEARWAVFFDAMGIPWQYEPEGYMLSNGRYYLPDFLLPECDTWVEVKGNSDQLDLSLMIQAACDLPGEGSPRLMILGHPPVPHAKGDYGWCGLDTMFPRDTMALPGPWGFGGYHEERRPRWLSRLAWIEVRRLELHGVDKWDDPVGCLKPSFDLYGDGSAQAAYEDALSARFEHGASGAGRR